MGRDMRSGTASFAIAFAILCSGSGFESPSLPYEYTALEPHISKQTLEFHHDKHHAKYVNTMNEMIADTPMAGEELETIIKSSHGKKQGLFNNAAQSWNHAFYWQCMKPGGGGTPTGMLAEKIDSS